MLSSQKMLRSGDSVIEVGGHIGYLSNWFAHLIGPTGKLLVFEPSDDNFAYLAPNLAPVSWAEIDRHGIADFEGPATFYIERLTGQNNSLLDDYEMFDANAAAAGVPADRIEVSIEVTTLDAACRERDFAPNFVKIDIEGAELSALQGMSEVLRSHQPVVFIEITKNIPECLKIFADADYMAFDDALKRTTGTLIGPDGLTADRTGNYFFIHKTSDRLPVDG